MSSDLEIAMRIRALLPHVTTDTEAEEFMARLVETYGGDGFASAHGAAKLDASAYNGKWGWTDSDDMPRVHGPFASREEAIADAKVQIQRDYWGDIEVGQITVIEPKGYVPDLFNDAEYNLLGRMTEIACESVDTDPEFACREGGELALEKAVRDWADRYVYIIDKAEAMYIHNVTGLDELIFGDDE